MICCNIFFNVDQFVMILVKLCPDFLLKQKIFLFGDKLLPVLQHGFLRSAENVYLHNLLVLFGKILFHLILYGGIVGNCFTYLWQMLLP